MVGTQSKGIKSSSFFFWRKNFLIKLFDKSQVGLCIPKLRLNVKQYLKDILKKKILQIFIYKLLDYSKT